MDCDVIVVGGGLAGTRAAATLAANGVSVVLLEGRDRLGGRTLTCPLGGELFDHGAQFIGPGQPRMYRLVHELDLALSPTPTAGRHALELHGRVSTYRGTIPFLNPLKLIKLHLNLWRLERLARRVDIADPWSSADATGLDALSLADWQQRHAFRGRDIEDLGETVLRSILGADPDEVSLLYFLWFVRSNGGLMPLVETHGGFQQDRIVGGTQQITERLGATLHDDALRLNEPVQSVRQDAEGVTVSTPDGTTRARRAVIAVPLATAGRIDFDPPLPRQREHLHREVVMGMTIKLLAVYDRPFWRERGLSGQAVGTSGMLAVVFDNTSPDGRTACLMGLVVGKTARAFIETPPAQRRAQILEELAGFFGEEARRPIAYDVTNWSDDVFSGGCPTGLFNVGRLASSGEALRAPVGRIHWAGTETARQCIGYMEGAVESGERVADEVLAEL